MFVVTVHGNTLAPWCCTLNLTPPTLITGTQKIQVEGFDEPPWSELWKEYLADASRFDAKKLKSLFGDSEPINIPPRDPSRMTLRDRKLIGDFLRKHHPRLAHEFALGGIPGEDANRLFVTGFPIQLLNLAGLVARSHGLPLRGVIEILPTAERRETFKVRVPFLMCVVRIADYIQIHAERAPKQVLAVRSLKSPLSRAEWDAHSAIEDINRAQQDPEALYIRAAPKTANQYLKLKTLFLDIQKELDECWAILGEIYGRYSEFDSLGIEIRRIRSNLDDTEEFSKTVTYIPDRFQLDAAGVDLLKLLIQPLYGNSPIIGIRELLQNAVDACRERDNLLKTKESQSTFEKTPDVHIVIKEVTEKEIILIITDCGVGMTADVIKKFFLKAGASFRRSDAWKRLHEDDEHHSKVLRSGRFGVGVLAAFLLGNRIQVTTRHISQPIDKGLKFDLTIEDDTVEVLTVSAPVGTEIRINISSEVFRALTGNDSYGDWDWYCLEYPFVQRSIQRITSRTRFLPQKYKLPDPTNVLPPFWNRLEVQNYQHIHWTHEDSPGLVCNGIRIIDHWFRVNLLMRSKENDGYASCFEIPNMSVFDPDGHLPLNLERTKITDLPFEEELLTSMSGDFLAYILANAPAGSITNSNNPLFYTHFKYPGIRSYDLTSRNYGRVFPLWCSSIGFSLHEPWHLHCQLKGTVLILRSITDHRPREGFQNWQNPVITFNVPDGLQEDRRWFRFCLFGGEMQHGFGPLTRAKFSGVHMILTKSFYDDVMQFGNVAGWRRKAVRSKAINDNWWLVSIGDCPDPPKEFLDTSKEPPIGKSSFAMWYNTQLDPVKVEPPITRAWRKLFNDAPILPYDEEERKKLFPNAYLVLGDRIKQYRRVVA